VVHPPTRLYVESILAWADAHSRRHGDWPNSSSGPVPESEWTTWRQIDHALFEMDFAACVAVHHWSACSPSIAEHGTAARCRASHGAKSWHGLTNTGSHRRLAP